MLMITPNQNCSNSLRVGKKKSMMMGSADQCSCDMDDAVPEMMSHLAQLPEQKNGYLPTSFYVFSLLLPASPSPSSYLLTGCLIFARNNLTVS